MNNIFNWNRFCKVIAKDFRNIWPLYGPTLVALATIPTAFWLLGTTFQLINEDHSYMDPSFRLFCISALSSFAMIMTPSRLYRTSNLVNEGIYYAMLPASKLEKYLSMWLFTLIVCPFMVFCAGCAIDSILTLIPFGPYATGLWNINTQETIYNNISFNTELGYFISSFFIALAILGTINSAAVFIFTNTIFKKHKVTQTFLWTWLIEFGMFILTIIILSIFSEPIINHIYQIEEEVEELHAIKCFKASIITLASAITLLFTWLGYRRISRMRY